MGMDGAVWRVRERRGGTRSAPAPEELNPVVHAVGTRAGADSQDTAQLLTHRIALLWSQNHPGVFAPGADPFGVQPKEIGGIVRVKDAFALRRVSQLLLVERST